MKISALFLAAFMSATSVWAQAAPAKPEAKLFKSFFTVNTVEGEDTALSTLLTRMSAMVKTLRDAGCAVTRRSIVSIAPKLLDYEIEFTGPATVEDETASGFKDIDAASAAKDARLSAIKKAGGIELESAQFGPDGNLSYRILYLKLEQKVQTVAETKP